MIADLQAHATRIDALERDLRRADSLVRQLQTDGIPADADWRRAQATNVVQLSSGTGQRIVYDAPGAPLLTLPPGTWKLEGGLSCSTVSGDDYAALGFYQAAPAPGGYAASLGSASRVNAAETRFVESQFLIVAAVTTNVRLWLAPNGNVQLRAGAAIGNLPCAYLNAYRVGA